MKASFFKLVRNLASVFKPSTHVLIHKLGTISDISLINIVLTNL